MNQQIEKLSPDNLDEFIKLIRVFEDVFEMKDFKMPDEQYLKQLLKREDFFVFIALFEDKLVGGITAYVLHQYYSTRPLVYIYDFAIKTEYQRKGIGRKLISAVKEYSRNFGAEEVFVQADLVDDHAVKFYRSTDGIPENVIHFYYPLK